MKQRNVHNTDDLAKEIIELSKVRERFVIAISGFAGAGKSTISQKLAGSLGGASIIHVDDFIVADENGAKPGYPHNWQRFEELVLRELHVTNTVQSRIFDWKSNRQVDERQEVGRFVIIDGPGELFQDAFRGYLDLLIWIDLPQDVANARGMKRDREEYQVDHDELWSTVWSPKEAETFMSIRPDLKADILFTNN
ncbi:MAG: putative phosphoribulokinase [Patescibacteria group bacterium]|jgi:uridine kinase|nr:putative phosphoribulokinase [Patescibacteria group bacterium]